MVLIIILLILDTLTIGYLYIQNTLLKDRIEKYNENYICTFGHLIDIVENICKVIKGEENDN